MATNYPRTGTKASTISIAILVFLLLVLGLYLYLRRSPQHQTQPDRPQSSSIVVPHTTRQT
jgi:LPXTG-motif cell wall-anchored protein